ncbi:MAG TPA: zinc ribbon domain-containing protein [Gemmatimonadaceae bacterium]|nr:zinc ribbon domain-containing protein [Gemmatimonadaceae bacterium]
MNAPLLVGTLLALVALSVVLYPLFFYPDEAGDAPPVDAGAGCPRCGAPSTGAARFCSACGAPLPARPG